MINQKVDNYNTRSNVAQCDTEKNSDNTRSEEKKNTVTSCHSPTTSTIRLIKLTK